MKKRAFLSPLAVSVAALLSNAPMALANAPTTDVVETVTSTVATNPVPDTQEFLIERAGPNLQIFADHESHSSHASHASHSSHHSGY